MSKRGWGWVEDLRLLWLEAARVDLRTFEDGPEDRIHGPMADQVLGLLHRSLGLLARVREAGSLESADRGPMGGEPEQGFAFAVDDLVSRGGDGDRLADLVEMADFHLSRKRVLVEAARAQDVWDVLDACQSALRGIRKALMALEHVACERQGAKAQLDYRTETAVSLEIRLAFAKFRDAVREVMGDKDPSTEPELLERRLLGGSTSLAILAGRDAYPYMRARDRRQIRGLQRKFHEARRAEAEERPRRSLEALRDLAAFAELVSLINQREELLEHDRRVARAALDAVEAMPPQEIPPAAWTRSLKPLRGRDPDLDQLIRRPETVPACLWLALLQPIAGEAPSTQAQTQTGDPVPSTGAIP